jgi:hypothetical protein
MQNGSQPLFWTRYRCGFSKCLVREGATLWSWDIPEKTEKSQVERVRRVIDEFGECTVGCLELRVLCVDQVSARDQWDAIAKLAMAEGWSFTFFPNGDVRFAPL